MDKTKIAVSIFNKYAKEYQDKFMDVNLYSDTFDLFCNSIAKDNPEVLEIACGPGNITKYLLQKRPDLKILGTDLSLNMLELAKINNPTAEFQLMDCRDIDKIDKKYSAIMCGFCLPYLSKEETFKFISDASRLLESNGILCLSTMEDDYNKSGFRKGSTGDEIFMHYHQVDYLTYMLNRNNFKIIDLQRKIYPEGEGVITTDLLIVAQKISEEYIVRNAKPEEFEAIGKLMVQVYSQLEGFPKESEQPNYYKMLANIGELANKPETELLVAVSPDEKIAGTVVYFGDMKHYGSGGTATNEQNASGFRLLAVDPQTRGKGIGKLLTNECIRKAKEKKRCQVVIHSTMAMSTAWKMYENLGFKRSEDLDFMQGELPVLGFRLQLE